MEDSGTKEIKLPSGKDRTVRKGKGRDLMRAHRASGETRSQCHIVCVDRRISTVDGNPLVYEDVLEMDLSDVLALEAEIMGGATAAQIFRQHRGTARELNGPMRPRQSSDSSPSDSPSQS